jgi:hypothetical protein
MEEKKEKDYEIVANFKVDNCTFTISQPVQESTFKELENFNIALAKAAFRQLQKP